MLATVTDPPRGISKSFAEESANAKASIIAASLSAFVVCFFILVSFLPFWQGSHQGRGAIKPSTQEKIPQKINTEP
jgi:hypothetical protein